MRTKLTPKQIETVDRVAHRHALAFQGHAPVEVPEVKAPEPVKEKKMKVKADPRRALLPGEEADEG